MCPEFLQIPSLTCFPSYICLTGITSPCGRVFCWILSAFVRQTTLGWFCRFQDIIPHTKGSKWVLQEIHVPQDQLLVSNRTLHLEFGLVQAILRRCS